jgi:hypothetical protein
VTDKKLDVFEFGRQLVKTKDLDPVYVVLHEAALPEKDLLSWLLAYFCFYHVGTASWIMDGDYWDRMKQAAASKEYPRSAERRHFRGETSNKAVALLEKRGGVQAFFNPLLHKALSVEQVMKQVQKSYAFGSWIAFKVADILERLGVTEVQFDDAAMFLFDSPKEGAHLMWEQVAKKKNVGDVGSWAVGSILDKLNPMMAPPRYERWLNAQEAETCLCKWKSYMNGHYHIGEDIEAVQKGLTRFKQCRLSRRLLAAGKKGGLW